MLKTTWFINSLLVLLFLLLVIPKNYSVLFGIIPTRLFMFSIFFGIYFWHQKIILKEKIIFKFNIFNILACLFILMSCVSLIVSADKIVTLYSIFKYISFIIFTNILFTTNFSNENIKKIFYTIFLAAGIVFIIGIIMYIFGINLNIAGMHNYSGGKGRISATLFNPIYLGAFANLIVILILFFEIKYNIIKKRLIGYLLNLLIFLAAINIALSFTRSAYIILIGILGYIVIYVLIFKKEKLKTIMINILLIITAFLYISPSYNVFLLSAEYLVENSFFKNFISANITDYEYKDYSSDSRKLFLTRVREVINENMYLGVGLGSYEAYFEDDIFEKNSVGYPHNNYLHVWVEIGVFGMIAFCGLILSIFLKIIYNIFYQKRFQSTLAILVLINFVLLGFFESVSYDSQLMPMFIITFFLIVNDTIGEGKNMIRECFYANKK